MRRNGWGAIARHFEARAEPEAFIDLTDGRLLVIGRYRGCGKQGGAALDAAFAHLIAFDQGHIKSLEQFTDTARWHDAAGPLRTVLLDFEGGVATLRLNRPDKGNAIDERMAADLAEAATQIAERTDVRAVLITGNGPNFTVGGDLDLFAGTAREQLPNRLRRMIDNFHLAIERLTGIDAPVVAAVRGGAGGGGLGLMYVADIVVAAEDTRFALGYGALGLTADGDDTWFLPRMVGMRRAQELFLLNRRLTAQEALAFGLVSRLVPDDQVESEATTLAAKLRPVRREPSAPSAGCCASRSRPACPISSMPKRHRSSSPAARMTRKRELPRSSQSDARIFAAIEPIKQTQTHFRGGRSGHPARPP